MIEIIFEEQLKTNLKKTAVKYDEEQIEIIRLRNCHGFDIYNVVLVVMISLCLLRSLYQKSIIYLSHEIDIISKILMVIQISIGAAILPISTAYI